jgi:hypothetical protein
MASNPYLGKCGRYTGWNRSCKILVYSRGKSCWEHSGIRQLCRPWEQIWKTWVPRKCKLLWLVEHDRCWTVDRLAHRGLPCPKRCPVCIHDQETINHLLVSCPFERKNWYSLLCQVGLQQFAPQATGFGVVQWLVGQIMACCFGAAKERSQFSGYPRHLGSLDSMQFLCFWWTSS